MLFHARPPLAMVAFKQSGTIKVKEQGGTPWTHCLKNWTPN